MAVSRDKIPGPRKSHDVAGWKDPSRYYPLIILTCCCIIWFVAGNRTDNHMVLPTLQSVASSFWEAITTWTYLENLLITLRRVLTGFLYACCIGIPLGLLMGYSDGANRALSPFINSARQVPVMAWVPLAIIWFGLGDGPTVFLIAFTGVFKVIINTINAVHDLDITYYHAARSLGAKLWQVIRDVVLPGSFPGIFTGCRLALGLGWMSVI